MPPITKAILFDIGGVILEEDELEREFFRCVRDILKCSGVTLTDEEFNKAIKKFVLSFAPSFTEAFIQHFTGNDFKKRNEVVDAIRKHLRSWSKDHPQKLNLGIKRLIQSLSNTYKLGLAGNQPSAVKNLLDEYDILRFFTTTEVSEDIGISKPDPRFFENILKKLGVHAREAIMIGDRLDNDIIPAKKLGMKAILVKVGLFAILEPRTPGEIPDATVSSTTELNTAIENVAKQSK